jgi:hypothetical protein
MNKKQIKKYKKLREKHLATRDFKIMVDILLIEPKHPEVTYKLRYCEGCAYQ